MLAGSCRLVPDEGGEPVALGAGDVVLLPHGAGHVLADPSGDTARAVPFEEMRRPVGDGPEVELLCGKYRLDRSRTHPLMAELPDVVHLPNRVGRHPELRAAVDLLARELETNGGRGPAWHRRACLDLPLIYMVRAWMSEAETGSWPSVLSDPVTTRPRYGRCTPTRPPLDQRSGWPLRRACPGRHWPAGSPRWWAGRRWRI
ncbi:cupin domain-containing protein [Streptomyces sp. L7]